MEQIFDEEMIRAELRRLDMKAGLHAADLPTKFGKRDALWEGFHTQVKIGWNSIFQITIFKIQCILLKRNWIQYATNTRTIWII